MREDEKVHGFDEEYEDGKQFEILILNGLKEKRGFIKAYRFEPEDKTMLYQYDIGVPEIFDGKIETKYDKKAAETQNLCIEVNQDGRISGLKKTEAKFWIHCDLTYIYIAYVKDIKELIIEKYVNPLHRLKNEPDFDTDLGGIILQQNFPKQQKVYTKYMDWYLIPKKLFRTICLEVELINEITYKDIK